MKNFEVSRRALLGYACQVPAAALFALITGCADRKQAASCADPAQLSDSETSLRASLSYVDDAPDPAKSCSGCAYFQSSEATLACGQCAILNGAVAAKGHCTSWTSRK